jgi:hypothetical protein
MERQVRDRPDGDPPPWERPGAARRDSLPYRGGFLVAVAVVTLVASMLGPAGAANLLDRPTPATYGAACAGLWLLSLGGLAFLWAATRADLAAMRAGRLDPTGFGQTEAARLLGWVAVGLQVLVVALVALAVLIRR